jgi:hypothetical protein
MVEKTVGLEQFGPVKGAAIERGCARRGALLEQFRQGSTVPPEPRTKAA